MVSGLFGTIKKILKFMFALILVVVGLCLLIPLLLIIVVLWLLFGKYRKIDVLKKKYFDVEITSVVKLICMYPTQQIGTIQILCEYLDVDLARVKSITDGPFPVVVSMNMPTDLAHELKAKLAEIGVEVEVY